MAFLQRVGWCAAVAIGAGLVAKATPDGHTLLFTAAAITISAALHQNLPCDPLKDFAGVTRIRFSTQPLIALAQAGRGQNFYRHAGAGSATHMNGERFRLAGLRSK